MFAKSAIVALFAAVAAAQLHEPTELDTSGGNAINRPLNEAVTAGTPFTITWTPSYPNTVSLLLLKGPSGDIKKIGAPIAEGIENSGSFEWTPPADFGPGLSETTGYGIQIIDDETGLFQYSTQFGITIPDDYEVPPEVPSSSEDGYGGYPTATPSKSSTKKTSSSEKPTSYEPTSVLTTSYVTSTGYPIANSSVIQPTKPITVPSSLLPSSTEPATSSPPESTGAASQLQAGLGLAAGVAGLFFML